MIDALVSSSTPAAATPARRSGVIDRMARNVLLRKLDGIRGGRVVIRDDAFGVSTHGSVENGSVENGSVENGSVEDGSATDGSATDGSVKDGSVKDGPATDHGLHATVTVRDARFYRHIVRGGSLGAADAYINGQWSADDLTSLLRIFARDVQASDGVERGAARIATATGALLQTLRANTRAGSRRNIHDHYDLGNDFFELFLDETMTYSCGIFESEDASLRDASVAKLDRICRKLDLRPTDHLLEIGTGWGSMAIHAACVYGCRVTTTTISREQHDLAQRRVAAAGVADRVDVRLEDYRDLRGSFDKIVSIEMIEAVGHEFLEAYFGACGRLLADDGLMVLQAITMPDQRYAQYRRSTDFIRRYVFPGSCLPSMGAMLDAVRRSTDLRLVHMEDITPHYARTLSIWRDRFMARLDAVRDLGFSDSFIRLWEYYLCYCEAGFAERYTGDVHLVLAKPGCRRAPILPPLAMPAGSDA